MLEKICGHCGNVLLVGLLSCAVTTQTTPQFVLLSCVTVCLFFFGFVTLAALGF